MCANQPAIFDRLFAVFSRLANRAPNRLWGRRLESPSAGLEIARVGIPLPGLRIQGPIRVLEGTDAVISVQTWVQLGCKQL